MYETHIQDTIKLSFIVPSQCSDQFFHVCSHIAVM